jgi:hypothetical protein
MRSFRPLRVVKRLPGLKIAVMALFKSIIAMLNIMFFILVLWIIFGILGMNLFLGKFWRCNDPFFPGYESGFGDPEWGGGCTGNYTVIDQHLHKVTVPRVWSNANNNFDNIANSVLTLFQITTLDDWDDIFVNAYAASDIGMQPVKSSNWIAKPYFMIFIYISAFFVMKLFVGIV